MRYFMAFLVVGMVSACTDDQSMIDVETACYEQSVARCEMMDCFNTPIDMPECVTFFTGWCETRYPDPITAEDHEACLESLESNDSCPVYPFTQQCDGDRH